MREAMNDHELGRHVNMLEVADDIERFLINQVDRLESEIQKLESTANGEAAQKLMQEFMEEREQWEVERQRQVERLRQESEWLSEAWRQLEKEQRASLARGNPPRAPEKEQRQPEDLAAAANQPQPADVPVAKPETGFAETTESSDSKWLQFQQLRREIQKHARNQGG